LLHGSRATCMTSVQTTLMASTPKPTAYAYSGNTFFQAAE
jgi:hypothetical protein